MAKVFVLLLAVLCVSNAWTNTPTMIIARIAQKDLEANGMTFIFLISLITLIYDGSQLFSYLGREYITLKIVLFLKNFDFLD